MGHCSRCLSFLEPANLEQGLEHLQVLGLVDFKGVEGVDSMDADAAAKPFVSILEQGGFEDVDAYSL